MSLVFQNGYRFGPFVLNIDRMCLQEGATDLELRPKAFDVLRHLVQQAGRVVSKDELVAAVWPNVIVNDDALAQCVRDIRKALRDEGETYVRTVPRRGYMFVAEVETLTAIGSRNAAGVIGQPVPAKWPWPVRRGLLAVLLLALVVIGSWNFGWRATPQAETVSQLSVAILPFTANAEDEWLADGIAEDIMTAVSRFRDLTVIARNSSFRFRDATADPKDVGSALRADYLLQGTVRRLDERLRITAQLVDTRTGASRWMQRYDRPMADLFDIQEEVAEAVATQLVIHAKEDVVARLRTRPPQSLEVHELVLRARKRYREFSREATVEMRELAERAIALDPNYSPAWEVLAAALLQFYYQPYDEHHNTPEILQQARAAAERSIALDGNFSTAHAILAATLVPARENEAALAANDRALALNPNDAVAIGTRGNVLSFLGRYEEAAQAWEEAERIDPFASPLAFALKAMALVMMGDYEKALVAARTCADRAPRLGPCYYYLAIALNELDRKEESEVARETLLDINPSFSLTQHQGLRSFRDPEQREHLAGLMRRAGFPD